MYALLTLVKSRYTVAGYLPSFPCVFMDQDEVEVKKKNAKENEVNIQPS